MRNGLTGIYAKVDMFRELYEEWVKAATDHHNKKAISTTPAAELIKLDLAARIAHAAQGLYADTLCRSENPDQALFEFNDFLRQEDVSDITDRAILACRLIESAEAYATAKQQKKLVEEGFANLAKVKDLMNWVLGKDGFANVANIARVKLLERINAMRKKRGESVLQDGDLTYKKLLELVMERRVARGNNVELERLDDITQLEQLDLVFDKGDTSGMTELGIFLDLWIETNRSADKLTIDGKDTTGLLQLAIATAKKGKDIYESESTHKNPKRDKYDKEAHDGFIVRSTAAFLFSILFEKGYGAEGQEMRNLAAEKLASGFFIEFGTGEGKMLTNALALDMRALNPEGAAVHAVECAQHLAVRERPLSMTGSWDATSPLRSRGCKRRRVIRRGTLRESAAGLTTHPAGSSIMTKRGRLRSVGMRSIRRASHMCI
jgi:hypothetical protein